MSLQYYSTRNKQEKVSASRAIINGLAGDGGLYVPESVPKLEISLGSLPGLTYQETAMEVMRLLLTDFTKEELSYCISHAYDSKFDAPEIVPVHVTSDASYLELYHGSTIAFKDMALSILPYLMTTAAKKNHEEKEIVILTATSGDTGKAALAGFADVPGTRIMVFYPKDGVSAIQELQMVTQAGDNTCVIGIRGNFDDAQTGVKKLFSDPELKEELAERGFRFSSANSINIGRLVPQIVYYVYAYGRLLKNGALKEGDPMNVVVPTGNFGNILAAWYSKQMGLPVGKLICASNENKVLFDFFETGIYDRKRPFHVTSSPSMDILISSNLERLIFESCGKDDEKTAAFMKSLSENGNYAIDDAMKDFLKDFVGGCADEAETSREIRRVFRDEQYVLDPHTAVASSVYRHYRERTADDTPAVIASTASPYKFARSVMSAIDEKYAEGEDFALIDALHEVSGMPVPEAVESLKKAPVRHKQVIGKEEMRDAVLRFLER